MDLPISACGCPVIEDVEWDLIERQWDDTPFFKTGILMFFHLPIGRRRREEKARRDLAAAGLTEATPNIVLLRDALFMGSLWIAVDKSMPDMASRMSSLEGETMIAKVASGSRRDVMSAVSSLLSYVRTKAGKHPKAIFFWQIDCTRCAQTPARRTLVLAEL